MAKRKPRSTVPAIRHTTQIAPTFRLQRTHRGQFYTLLAKTGRTASGRRPCAVVVSGRLSVNHVASMTRLPIFAASSAICATSVYTLHPSRNMAV